MPVHHRLRFLTFPMRASRLCSLWSGMRPLRFRRVPFGRDVAFDPGGVTASRIMMPHILPSTVPSRYLEQPPCRHRPGQGPLSLERLPQHRPAEDHVARLRLVHSTLPAARSARRLSTHPLLRLPGQPPPPAEAGAVSSTSCHAAARGDG